MAQDLSTLYISQSFQNLVQRSASGAFNVLATATGTEFIPISASYAISSSHAVDADLATTASYALTASFAENVLPDTLQTVLNAGNSASGVPLILSSSAASGGAFIINNDANLNTIINVRKDNSQQFLYQAGDNDNRLILATTGAQSGSILFSNNNSTAKDSTIECTGDLILEASSSAVDKGLGEIRIDGLLHAPYSASVSESLGVSGSILLDGNMNINNSNFVSGAPISIAVKNPGDNAIAVKDGSIVVSGSTGLQLLVAGQGTFGIGNAQTGLNAHLTVGDNNTNSSTYGIIVGESNTLNVSSKNAAIIASENSTVSSENAAIIGGEQNSTNSSFTGIFGAASSTITNGDTSVIVGGYQNILQGSRTYTLGGNANQINNSAAEFSGIIGGQNNRIDLPVTASAVIGGKGIAATNSETVYVPNFSISGSLQDAAGSTGANATVLTSDGAGKVLWAVGSGGSAFPFTGSAQITGSLSVTGSSSVRGPLRTGMANGLNTVAAGAAIAAGSNLTINSTDAAIVGGSGHTVTGDTSVIVGGEQNTINSGFSGIFGAASSGITNGDTAVILGGYQNNLQGTRTYLVGGNQNQVSNSGAEFSGIIGGQLNNIPFAATASAIIGGKSIVASKSETVYVPALEVVTGGANVTGSIIGAGNIRAGQAAAAFASDSIELGSSVVPVTYGNMIIHGSETRDLGNRFNSYQIVSSGGTTVSLFNSAFTGLGNNVHGLGWGGNSTGRADNVKLWSSGSAALLNVETETRFAASVINDVESTIIASNTASLDLTLSNTFTISAQSTTTHITTTNMKAGQVINVQIKQDAGGTGVITFNTAQFKFPGGTAPTLTATANAIDLISAVSYDGVTLLSNAVQNYS